MRINMSYSEFKKLFFILRFPIVVFTLDKLINIPFDLYKMFPLLDIPMHFIGGASIAVSAVLWWRYKCGSLKTAKINKIFSLLWIIGIVSFTAIVWEFYEFASDYFFHTEWQFGSADVVGDMFFGLAGGGAAGWYKIYRHNNTVK